EADVQSVTYADVLTATEAAACYVGRDLRYLVQAARVPLAKHLNVPRELARDDDVVVELLLHDIERMLRQHLIRAVHLMLSDKELNDNNQYSVRYHAHYEVRRETLRSSAGVWGDIIKAPARTLANAHFTLGISWREQTSRDKRRSIKPPEYFFSW